MAIHIGSRPIWLVRLPHSEDTAGAWRRKLQGSWPAPTEIQFSESNLSPAGVAFAERLRGFVEREAQQTDVAVFACTYTRAVEVVERLVTSGNGPGIRCRIRSSLNPQERGTCFGLSLSQIAE